MKKGFLLSAKKAPRAKIGPVNYAQPPGEREQDDWQVLSTKTTATTNKSFLSTTTTTSSSTTMSHTSSSSISETGKQNTAIPNGPKDGGMKRGFLLANNNPSNNNNIVEKSRAPRNRNANDRTTSSSQLPQCKLEETSTTRPHTGGKNYASEEEKKKKKKGVVVSCKKRIPTISSALLECEDINNEQYNNYDDENNQQCEQQQPVAVISSLLRLIGDDNVPCDDDPKGENNSPSFGCENNELGVTPKDYARNDNPSLLDNWITQSPQESSSSSSPSLILPSSESTISGRSKSKPLFASSKVGKPLIVEVDNPTMVEEVVVANNNSRSSPMSRSTESTTKSPCLVQDVVEQPPIADSSHGIEQMSTKNIPDTDDTRLPSNKSSIETTPSPPLASSSKVYLHFANDASLLLAQLRHSMKSKLRRNSNNDTAISKMEINSVIGVGTYMNKQSAMYIQSFVAKHLNERPRGEEDPDLGYQVLIQQQQLDSLWKMILEPIAQDYAEGISHHSSSLSSRKKKKKKSSKTTTISPHLGFGLGVVEFLDTTGMMAYYESLANLFVDVARASASGNARNVSNNNTARNNNTIVIDKDTNDDNDLDDREKQQIKQLKISALGAVHLIRCRMRCIGITMTNLEIRMERSSQSNPPHPEDDHEGSTTEAILKDVPSEEIQILLTKMLPALESIVSSGSDTTATSIGGSRRRATILISSSVDACFELIETSSRVVVLQHMLRVVRATSAKGVTGNNKDFDYSATIKSMQVWRDLLPVIERLLAAKQRWALNSIQGDGMSSNSNGPSRVRCAMAVFDDWSNVIKTSKRSFFDRFVGDDWRNEGADFTEGLNLFWNLSGLSLKREGGKVDDTSQIKSCFRIGGMAQSLCQRQECRFGIYVDGHHLHDLGGSVEAEDLVSLLQESATLTDSVRAARKSAQSSEAWTKINHQRAAIRAFASWLSRGNKAIRSLTENTKSLDDDDDSIDLFDSAMGSLVALLRSESKHCVDISVANLSMLWSASPDFFLQDRRSDQTTPPQCFLNLLDALQTQSSQNTSDEKRKQSANDDSILDSTSKALCAVVTGVALQKPSLLVPFILKMKGREEIRVEIVLSMLEELPNNLPSQHDSGTENLNDIVYRAATKMILETIESVSYLRSRIRSNPTLFSNVPCEIFVPQILEHLARYYVERKSPNSVSSLSGLLCNIMKANANSGHADDFIRCVVSSLHAIDQSGSSQMPTAQENKTISTHFFSKNGATWRLALLGEASSSDSAYKESLLATAKSMIEMPSSSTPLALLASLVDNQFHTEPSGDNSNDHFEKRIFIATSGIIHFAMDQISLSRQNDVVNEQTVFSRLSPLLLLRRMPRSYYRIVHKELLSEKATRDAVCSLTAFLSSTLKAHAMKNDQSNLAKEEKKLLAELAGHCLPFSGKVAYGQGYSLVAKESPVSLFENICTEPFADTLYALRGDQEKSQSMVQSIRGAKAALYAVSHCLPLAYDDDDGGALINTASFVFEVLTYQPDFMSETAQDNSELFQREIMMLQSGCRHFLAVCMDFMARRKANAVEPTKLTPLIEDLGSPSKSKEIKATNSCTILEALSKIYHTQQSIITTGEIGWEVVYHKFYSFPRPDMEEHQTVIQFPPSSRTSMLNSIVMLSQVSRAEDKRLDWLASNTIPTLVEWANAGPMDESIRHPFCIAAALQVVYTLLARCGSFAWLVNCPNTGIVGGPSETDFVCRTLRCALKLFHSGEVDEPTLHVLRLAALKVILTAIALNQTNESETQQGLKGYLTPREIQQAMAALHGAANVDKSPEVRRLANQILPYLV